MFKEFFIIKSSDGTNVARIKLVMQFLQSLSAGAQLLWLVGIMLAILFFIW